MRNPLAGALLLAAAGCASAGPGPSGAPPEAEVPANLAGVPVGVIAGRALFDLDSGDPERARRARCVLLALPEGPGMDGLRDRVRSGTPGTAARLEALSILAERGDSLDGAESGEILVMCLREMGREDRAGRSTVLALDRLRSMGRGALPRLREESRPGGPYTGEAGRALRVLFDEPPDHRLRESRP